MDELLSWAECFDKADIGTKHLIVSRLIERVDVRTGYKVHIKFKISLKQFLGQEPAGSGAFFEGIATLVQLIDPQGGLLHVNYRNPVQHIIIVVAALGFGVAAYLRHVRRTKQ